MLETKSFGVGHTVMNSAAFTKSRSVARQAVGGKTRAVLTIAVIAAALAMPEMVVANEVTWYGVTRDLGELQLYLDRGGLTHDGNTEKAWLLFDFRNPQSMPDGFKRYQSVKALVAVRCADRTYAREKEINYSGPRANGEVVSTYAWKPDERQFEKAVPFTNSQAVVDAICGAAAARTKG